MITGTTAKVNKKIVKLYFNMQSNSVWPILLGFPAELTDAYPYVPLCRHSLLDPGTHSIV